MNIKHTSPATKRLLISMIEDYMKKERITRSELAKKLGVHRSYVTRVLKEDFSGTIETLLGVAKALGLEVKFYAKPIDNK